MALHREHVFLPSEVFCTGSFQSHRIIVTETTTEKRPTVLKPLPYQLAIRDYLKSEEPEVWQWFASNTVRDDQAEAVRFDLLKTTYRVDRESQPNLYQVAEEVASQLSLDVPITIYQAQNPQGINASLAYLPNEAHIVLHGSIASKLDDAELRCLLGHELSHLMLWRDWEGEFLLTSQVLDAMVNDSAAHTAHFATSRLFDLYGEIFCDRGALHVVNDPLAVVSMLVKVHTDADEVDPKSYLSQAEEIFAQQSAHAGEQTHPETFIRARAVKLWSNSDPKANSIVQQMIEGPPALETLDLLAQQKISALTKRLLDALLAPAWMQSDVAMAHARGFFDGYTSADDTTHDDTLQSDLDTTDQSLQDYYCYVLLDFVAIDRDLEEYPLAAALKLSHRLGFKDRFVEIARKELRLRKRQIEKIDADKDKLMAKAKKQAPTP